MNNLEKMCRDHFNEPILVGTKLVRLIGYGEDDMDCYIIYLDEGNKIVWHTCVGGYIFLTELKNQDKQGYYDDFKRADIDLDNAGIPKQDEFILDIKASSSFP